MNPVAPTRKAPPLWFRGALVAGAFIAALAIAAMFVLTYEREHEPLRIGNRTFVIPPEQIVSARGEPDLFVRIRPPGKPFEIIYDQQSSGARDRLGVPRIFSINDQSGADTYYSRDQRTLAVCRRGSTPSAGCGTWINYAGVKWSVLFPDSHVRDADRITREASAILRRYDSRATRLMP